MESRKMKMMFQKGGSGSVTTRLAIPKSWVDKLGVTQENREVIIEFDGEKVMVRKMNDADRLTEKIDSAIEKEIVRTGRMGTETVTAHIHLSEEERELFLSIDKYDDGHFCWEFDDAELIISYTEEV